MWLFGGSSVFIQTTGEVIYLKISWDDADGVKSERYDDRRRGVVHGVDRKGLNFYSNKSQKLKSISYLKLLKNWIWRRLCSTNVSFFFKIWIYFLHFYGKNKKILDNLDSQNEQVTEI